METEKLRTITTADVRRFICAKHITGCPVCNHYDWRIKGGTTSLDCHHVDDTRTSCKVQLDVVMLICQNCGALQLHDEQVIARWLSCHEH